MEKHTLFKMLMLLYVSHLAFQRFMVPVRKENLQQKKNLRYRYLEMP